MLFFLSRIVRSKLVSPSSCRICPTLLLENGWKTRGFRYLSTTDHDLIQLDFTKESEQTIAVLKLNRPPVNSLSLEL